MAFWPDRWNRRLALFYQTVSDRKDWVRCVARQKPPHWVRIFRLLNGILATVLDQALGFCSYRTPTPK
jgi:hypothetical protein